MALIPFRQSPRPETASKSRHCASQAISLMAAAPSAFLGFRFCSVPSSLELQTNSIMEFAVHVKAPILSLRKARTM